MQDLVDKQPEQTYSSRLQNSGQYKCVGRDAQVISVRAATPHDKEKLRQMSFRLSPQTIYRRFHHPYPHVPDKLLALMLDVDHYDKESLLALAGGEIVGHAMYVVRSDTCSDAEVAFVVEDEWQSSGVGKLLLSEIAQKARLRGVETFSGDVLRGNRRVLGLLGAVFAEVECVTRDGLYHFSVALEALKPPALCPVQKLRRAA